MPFHEPLPSLPTLEAGETLMTFLLGVVVKNVVRDRLNGKSRRRLHLSNGGRRLLF